MAERPKPDRMFAVIVLGGIAIATAAVTACGGNVVVDGTHSGGVGGSGAGNVGGLGGTSATTGLGGFPQEAPVDATVTSSSTGFPMTSPVTDGGIGGFPNETAQPIDAGTTDAGFPHET